MKILVALTYYTPYVSGLTIYAARIAKAWAERGHQVTVLTSQYDPKLPREEILDGVRIVRAPVLFRISKGVIMPAFWRKAVSLVRESDVVNIHLPQFDAAWLAWQGHHQKKLTVLTYHCDLQMPSGFVNQLANRFVLWMNDLAGKWCDVVVAYTEDYAGYSFFLPRFKQKQVIIQPPVTLPIVTDAEVAAFREEKNPQHFQPIIGMACRFAADKGVEVLLNALPKIIEALPDVCVFFAGPYQDVLGESAYYSRLKPRIEAFEKAGHWRFMGSLPPQEMAKFYRVIDVLTMPSLNRTDSFGLVQIEAMMNGVPVVAANLPGIRVPVTRHQMGRIIPIGDSDALAREIIAVLQEKRDYHEKCIEIMEFYAPDHVAELYEKMFGEHGIKNG